MLLSSCATPPGSGQNVATEERARAEPVGALNADVSQATIHQTICVPGWTATVRPSTSYTNGVKLKLMREQGLASSDAFRYELDHYVPLALGGHPRNPRNLWLQLWDGEWGARTKDRLEVKMKTLVCAGHLTLESAQGAVRANWRAAYRLYVGRPSLADPVDDHVD